MSTDYQKYSVENQKSTILRYARDHGFKVIKTYLDAGRSGVILKHREGLQALLTDVLGRNAGYKVILVYDVSRWGRFQDVDEAAHYEFLCRNSGIPIHYCAEQFRNDGKLPDTIYKALKRTMAAEYSRELGVKVFEGQKRLVLTGRKMGGIAGYGLRRVMISENNQRRRILYKGDRKSLVSDRVVLAPGPKEEVECVQRIFAMALRGVIPAEIARRLNSRKIPYLDGMQWNGESVSRLLRNPKYAGCYAWNKYTCRLHTRPKVLPPEQWILKPGALLPIITQKTFGRVQEVLKARSASVYSKEELLNRVRQVLRQHGRLTKAIIESSGLAHTTLRHYLGTMLQIYETVGYKAPARLVKAVDRRHLMSRLSAEVGSKIIELFPKNARLVYSANRCRLFARFDDSISVLVKPCLSYCTATAGGGWSFFLSPRELDYQVLIGRLDKHNKRIEDFLLFPWIDTETRELNFLESNSFWKWGKQVELEDLYEAARYFSLKFYQPDLRTGSLSEKEK